MLPRLICATSYSPLYTHESHAMNESGLIHGSEMAWDEGVLWRWHRGQLYKRSDEEEIDWTIIRAWERNPTLIRRVFCWQQGLIPKPGVGTLARSPLSWGGEQLV